MKKRLVLVTVMSLSLSQGAYAQESWWDSLKSMLGMDDAAEQTQKAPATVDGIVGELVSRLGITEQQAQQGLASILNFLKTTAESEQFAELKTSLPGVEEVLTSVPDISKVESDGLIGGLLEKASELSTSVKALNDLKKQFEAADLHPEMIQDFVKTAETYLDTPEGQAAKQKLSELIDSLLPK